MLLTEIRLRFKRGIFGTYFRSWHTAGFDLAIITILPSDIDIDHSLFYPHTATRRTKSSLRPPTLLGHNLEWLSPLKLPLLPGNFDPTGCSRPWRRFSNCDVTGQSHHMRVTCRIFPERTQQICTNLHSRRRCEDTKFQHAPHIKEEVQKRILQRLPKPQENTKEDGHGTNA